MPNNVLRLGHQIFSVSVGIIVLIGAALTFVFSSRTHADKAAEKGHRPAGDTKAAEIVRPDGFIDSFAGTISEAGGGVPLIGTIVFIVVIIAYFVYLFYYWNPGRW